MGVSGQGPRGRRTSPPRRSGALQDEGRPGAITVEEQEREERDMENAKNAGDEPSAMPTAAAVFEEG